MRNRAVFWIILFLGLQGAAAFTAKKHESVTRPAFAANNNNNNNNAEPSPAPQHLHQAQGSGNWATFAFAPASVPAVYMASQQHQVASEDDEVVIGYSVAIISCAISLALGFGLGYGT